MAIAVAWGAGDNSLACCTREGLLRSPDRALFGAGDATRTPANPPWVGHSAFATFLLMCAIITPAVLIGAAAERITFRAMMLVSLLWMFLVYIPIAHMAWASDGLFNGVWNAAAPIKALDFAGGFAVEMASGWSALALIWILGPRRGFGKDPMPPHSMVLAMVGAGRLWVGWYGFNGGAAGAAEGIGSKRFGATTQAAAGANLGWPGVGVAAPGTRRNQAGTGPRPDRRGAYFFTPAACLVPYIQCHLCGL